MLSKGNNALAIPQHESLQSADGKYEKKLENVHHKKAKETRQTLESELVFKPVEICNRRQQMLETRGSECKLTAGQ